MLDSLTNATLFAPNNYAIRSIPDQVKQSWMTNPEKLKQVLMYHLVQPGVRQQGLANNQMVKTGLKGQSVRMNFYQSVWLFLKEISFENKLISFKNRCRSLMLHRFGPAYSAAMSSTGSRMPVMVMSTLLTELLSHRRIPSLNGWPTIAVSLLLQHSLRYS